MKNTFLLITIVAGLLAFSCSPAIKPPKPVAQKAAEKFALQKKLPLDPKIKTGKLENGLTYYIRENAKPEKRVELRLVLNAGSILETDEQQGLAHLCEHMAFNGSKHFRKQDLVNYLESIGMRFGADLNAYTSFDETVYMLQVPTDSAEIMEKAFLVLEDWAHWVSYDDSEIDKERGVVIEEWRLGRGARMRMLNKELPVLLKDSRYAVRLPIGQKAVLDTFKHETLKSFYKDWYRPNLMAVVVVGDIDTQKMEDMIRKHFAHLQNPQQIKERKFFPVPDHKKPDYVIATDPEATRSEIQIYYPLPVSRENTFGDYRQKIVESLFSRMLNQRFNELTQKKNPPFVYAYSYKGNLVRMKDAFILGAMAKDNGLPRAFRTILTEAKRVKNFGFRATELERQKKTMLRGMEKSFAERNKTMSRNYADEYKRNFLQGEPIPGIEVEYEMYKQFLPGITVDEVNALIGKWMNDSNRIVSAESPEKEGLEIPTVEQLEKIMSEVEASTVEAYHDKVITEPLLSKKPAPSPVIDEKVLEKIGVTEWTLKNGVRVILKPTDFKDDEVLFQAFSPGGYSLVDDADLLAAKTSSGIVNSSGYGKFNLIDLQKLLSGKIARVGSGIGQLTEGLRGNASPKDLETLFQLIYLNFTAPREDSTAFLSFKSRMKAFLENQDASPEAVFQDSVTATITQHNPRFKPLKAEMMDKLDLKKSLQIYRDRFADASDFTFIFVGNFTAQKIKPLVETYLGGLPSIKRKENWRDTAFDYPRGVVKNTARKGVEPKSLNTLLFSGPFEWNAQNRSMLKAMTGVLRIKLRERLREDKSGTYGVRIYAKPEHFPRQRYSLTISFGCAPERVDELTKEVFAQIDSLKNFPVDESYLNKVKEISARSYETNIKRNPFWLDYLKNAYYHGSDPLLVERSNELMQSRTIKDIREAAKKYLHKDNYVQVTLYPEK